jgi:hypothetical protein
MKVLATLLVAVLALSACKDAQKPDPTLGGRWSGTMTASGTTVTVSMTLAQSGESVSGAGTMSSTSTSLALTVSGTCTYPNVSLTLASGTMTPSNFTGTFATPDDLAGVVNGSGFVNIGLALRRQT